MDCVDRFRLALFFCFESALLPPPPPPPPPPPLLSLFLCYYCWMCCCFRLYLFGWGTLFASMQLWEYSVGCCCCFRCFVRFPFESTCLNAFSPNGDLTKADNIPMNECMSKDSNNRNTHYFYHRSINDVRKMCSPLLLSLLLLHEINLHRNARPMICKPFF